MHKIVIEEVETRKQIKMFLCFQKQLYKKNKFFVSPKTTNEKKLFGPGNLDFNNKIFKCFLALRESKVLGRIAVIIDRQEGGKKAAFTRLDFIDGREIASALISAAEAFARRAGAEMLIGPYGFGENDVKGLLVDGFDRASKSAYNYAYYNMYLEELGFEKDREWIENGTQRFRIYKKALV